uniref:Sodium-coupled monocarboxylate transporter 1 n=1 Tax=Timema poppense TaxID=170557 RepID=A0A7R9CL76_TIMPO|nr:unnamed protein product [Timema poppensis]
MSLLNATLEGVETVQRNLHFTWLDHSVFAFMLVMSTVVGVLIGVCGKQDTKVDYLLGGKKMGILPISMSLNIQLLNCPHEAELTQIQTNCFTEAPGTEPVDFCIAIIILGLIKIGGFKNMWETSSAGGRIEFFNTDPSPFARNTIWTIAVGTSFGWLSSLGVSQGMVQKFIALPDLRSARLALMFFSVGLLFMKMMSVCVGLIIYTAYHDCDPIVTKQISKADQLLPYFTMDTASKIPGLPGLFVAGIFSAGLSTMSSYLNCLSATIYEDFISPLIKGNKKLESKAPFFMKSIVVFVGVVCLCMVFIVERLGGILQVAIATSGVTSGATLGIFVIGMFFPWANSKGCLVGSIASLLVMGWIVSGAQHYKTSGVERYPYLPLSTEGCEKRFNFTPPVLPEPTPLPEGMGDDAFIVYKISFHYYCMIGTIIAITVGMVVSYFTGFQNPKEVDSRLLVPFMQKYGSSYQEAPTEPLEKELMTMTPPPQYEQVRRTSMAA